MHIRKNSEGTAEAVVENRLLNGLLQFVRFLPMHVLDRAAAMAAEDRPRSALVVELDEEADIEPIGVRILLTAVLFPNEPLVHSILRCLAESLKLDQGGDDFGCCCIVYFLEDIRSKLLPIWKSFNQSQLENADFSRSSPFQQRMLEARRLHGIFELLRESTLDRKSVV